MILSKLSLTTQLMRKYLVFQEDLSECLNKRVKAIRNPPLKRKEDHHKILYYECRRLST